MADSQQMNQCFLSKFETGHKITLITENGPQQFTLQKQQSQNLSSKINNENLLQQSIDEMLRDNYQQVLDQKLQKINKNCQDEFKIKEQNLWVKKYTPQRFDSLLSNDKINREVLCWLKAWDPIVFPKKKKIIFQENENKNLQQPQNTNYYNITYDLQDKQCVEFLQNNVILLSGSPGTGKTTLAKVVAKQCGYKPIIINASEERTPAMLLNRIESITKSNSLDDDRPSLLIFDEVDGTFQNENQSAIDRLLKYIFTGEKKKNKNQENQSSNKLNIKRPVIFICNDMFGKGLKELRKRSIVFQFKNDYNPKLIQRLQEICNIEKIKIKNQILQKIVEQCEYDIRNCLNQLETIVKGNSGEEYDLSFLVNQQVTKSLVDIIDDISFYNKQVFQNKLHFCFNEILQHTNYNLFAEGIFLNYINLKSLQIDFLSNVQFMELLAESELIDLRVRKYQMYELQKFTMLPAYFLTLKMQTNSKQKILFPTQALEYRKKQKETLDIVQKLQEKRSLVDLQYQNNFSLIHEYLSYVNQIIQPNFQSSLLNQNERKILITCIQIMLEFNIELIKEEKKDQEYTNQFSLNFEKLLIYNNKYPENTLKNEVKILIGNNYQFIKNQRFIKDKADSIIQDVKIQAVNQYDEINKKAQIKKKKANDISFKYKYIEGFNNAVKHELKIGFFFNKFA